jgi:hypothetical protein
MSKGRTVGIDADNINIPLEEYLFKLAAYKNTTVIGFFDCCRDEEEEEEVDRVTLKGERKSEAET